MHRPKLSYSRCVKGISTCTWRVEFKGAESVLGCYLTYAMLVTINPSNLDVKSVQILFADRSWVELISRRIQGRSQEQGMR